MNLQEFFNQNYGLIITIFSLFVAVISLFLSPFIADHFNAKNQTKAMQEKWMDYLRVAISDYITNCEQFRYKRTEYLEFCSSGKKISHNHENGSGDLLQNEKLKEQEDIYPRIISLQRKLKLLFKKKSKDWPNIKKYTDKMWAIANSGGQNATEYNAEEERLVQKTEDILEEEWIKITSPTKLRRYYKHVLILLLAYIAIIGTLLLIGQKHSSSNKAASMVRDTVYVQTFDPLYIKQLDSMKQNLFLTTSRIDSLNTEFIAYKRNTTNLIARIRKEKALKP